MSFSLSRCTSIRSKNNIKINKTISKLIENKLIISGGGHDEAGGFSAKKERLSDLEEFINKKTKLYIDNRMYLKKMILGEYLI